MKSQVQSLLNPNKKKTWQEELESEVCGVLPSLTYTQRLTGCLCCMTLGFLLTFGSFMRFSKLLQGDPIPFVTTFTMGNIIALCGTCFMSGPKSQLKRMFKKTRRVASILYMLSITGTLTVALALKDWQFQTPTLLFCIVIQYTSLIWYTLSYIPFARKMATSACKSCCKCDEV